MSPGISNVMIIAGAVLLQGCSLNQPRATATKTASTEHLKEAAIIVDTRNGAVDIAADTAVSDVQITAVITCGGVTQAEADRRLAAATISVSRDTTRALTVKPVFPPANGSAAGTDGAKFTIRLPDAAGVTVTTSNGSVAVKSLAGALKIDTSNGSVKIDQHAGDAVVKTSNGGATIAGLHGNLQFQSSNGGVSVSDLAGTADVKTSNGGITLSLAGDQTGPVKLVTSNGGVTATLGSAFHGLINASTSNGKLTVDDAAGIVKSKSLSNSAGTLTVGEGGEPSTIQSSNGSIKIRTEK